MLQLTAVLLALLLLACCAAGAGEDSLALKGLRPGDRVLFQGDSITDGNRGRDADPNHILGHGYAFIIAADIGAGFPQDHLTFLNRGISGNQVTDLAKRWQADTLDLKPTVLSILIGVNDSAKAVETPNAVPVEEFERVYDQLLGDTLKALPQVRLVLCEPFILKVGRVADNWTAWESEVRRRQEVVQRLATKYHAPLVRFQKVFDQACERAPAEYWIWDGVHPTYSGHQLMADEWRRTIEQAWVEKK